MTKPIYPPFTEADCHNAGTSVDISDAIVDKSLVVQSVVEARHIDLNILRRHPWCRDCEFDHAKSDLAEVGVELKHRVWLESRRQGLEQAMTKALVRDCVEFARNSSEEVTREDFI